MPPSTMDLEPIYCAEQISVPPDLAGGLLRASTRPTLNLLLLLREHSP